MEEHKEITKYLIDILRLDPRISGESDFLEIIAILFLANSERKEDASKSDIKRYIQDRICDINPKIWSVLGNVLDRVTSNTIYLGYDYIRSYNLTQYSLGKIFNDFLYEQARNYSKYRGEFIQPMEVTKFICELVQSDKNMTVYNPFAGMASYGVDLKKHHYIGQEVNTSTWAISWIQLFLNEAFIFDYYNEDSISNWREGAYDLIISTPPFNKINSRYDIEEKTFDEFFINKALNSLNAEGKIACLLPDGFFFSTNKSHVKLRNKLVELNLIELIVSLPLNTMYNTAVKTSVLILNKNKSKEKNFIKFVDGSSFYIKENLNNRFTYNELFVEIRRDNPEYVRKVSEDIIRKNSRLDVSFYSLEDIFTPEGFVKKKLKKILEYNNKGCPYTAGNQVISIADLKDNPFDPLSISTVSKNNTPVGKSVYYSDENILLVSLRFNLLKPTYFEVTNNRLYYSSNISGFHLRKGDEINIEYLLYELNAEYVKSQLKAYSVGTVMPYLKVNDFLEIEILIPSLDIQSTILTRAKDEDAKEKVRKTGLENYIAKEKNKYKQGLNIRTHRIRPYLSGLSDNLDLLIQIFENNQTVSQDNEVVADYSVADLLANMKQSMDDMKVQFRKMTTELRIGDTEVFDMRDFFGSYSFKTKNKSLSYEIIKEINEESFKINHNQKVSSLVTFNKENLKEIVDLTIENAELHGFIDHNIDFYKVKLSISYEVDSQYLILSIKNNGAPMNSDFTEDQYFANGIISGATGNTGTGGFRVKDIVDELDGKINMINNPNSEYPVEVLIYLPITL